MFLQTTNIEVRIGKQITEIRKKLHLTQSDLGDIIGVSFQQIQKYEKGINRISASRLYILSRKLKIPMDDFFLSIDESDIILDCEM